MVSQVSSFVSIDDLIGRYVHAQLVYVAAKLGLADLTWKQPRTIEALAALADVHPEALKRVMASLVVLGVFERKPDDTYQLAAGHEMLLSDHPGSIRDYVIVSGEVYYRAFAELLFSVKTGKTGCEAAFGKSFFEHLGEQPDLFAHFNWHMSRRMRRDAEAVLTVYDFAPYASVVDVGGGNGLFLSLLLQTYPQMQGTLFELPSAKAQAQECLQQAGVVDRCEVKEGDFFVDALPAGGDLYILSLIVHDWDDEHALTILRRCRQAMPAGSKLVLIEFVLPEHQPEARVAAEDLFMLVVTGGRERTLEQFRALLRKAGFRLTSMIPTPGRRSIIEAIPIE